MTLISDIRAKAEADRNGGDGFAAIALILSFALTMFGLVLTAHPQPESQIVEPATWISAP